MIAFFLIKFDLHVLHLSIMFVLDVVCIVNHLMIVW